MSCENFPRSLLQFQWKTLTETLTETLRETLTETLTDFASVDLMGQVWSILTAPLILGNDVRNLSAECSAIVLNKEVIAVNQVGHYILKCQR
jgi:hypothetical protein